MFIDTTWRDWLVLIHSGEVAEWLKAVVLKTTEG